MTIRILLADDHRIVLDGLRAVLEKQPRMEVVGEATDGRQAVRLTADLKPDVVLMDISMPELNGVDAIRAICARRGNSTRVLCLSMHSETRFFSTVLEAGASGYLLKDCAVEELCRAIESVARGETYLCTRAAGKVVEALRVGKNAVSPALDGLTARQREVLQLIAEGHSTREIATRLHVSVKTVGTHREHLMEKLGIHTIAGLTKFAIRNDLTSVERNS